MARFRHCRTTVVIVVLALLSSFLIWWYSSVLDQHGGTAAWVQAVGAILIICATAWIASRASRETADRERLARQELWEIVALLSRSCIDALDNLLKAFTPAPLSDHHGHFIRSYAPGDFQIPMDALAAIPLHQIGDVHLVTAVLSLRGAMNRIKHFLDGLAEPTRAITLDPVRNQRTDVFNAFASVLRIVNLPGTEDEISRVASRT